MRVGKFRILGGLVLAAGAAILFFSAYSECTTVTGGDDVAIDVSAMSSGSARAFCYTDQAGERLRFILARGSDGKVRSVFDACRQCSGYHRGYRLAGGEMICRVCGNHYSVDRMNEGEASCVPVGLAHQDDGEVVHIKTADLKAGRAMF
jgi:uncharacterized membrane protein